MQMNVQLHHVVSDITGVTGLAIIRAILEGERNPAVLAEMRDSRCKESPETIEAALRGNFRPEHLFALRQAVELYDTYTQKITACDHEMERTLSALNAATDLPAEPQPTPRTKARSRSEPTFDVRNALYGLLGVDLTQIHGVGPYLALQLVGECGDDMSRWPSAQHFTSWLTLAPANKISGGRVLSTKTRKSSNRAAYLFRMAALAVGRTDTALGAFYRRLGGRIGKAKAVTATARKIAVLFYNSLMNGLKYVDPGAAYHDKSNREQAVKRLKRRAAALGLDVVAGPDDEPQPA